MSRSEFFTAAARRYLAELDASTLTTRINEALDRIEPDGSSEFAVRLGRTTLAGEDDEW